MTNTLTPAQDLQIFKRVVDFGETKVQVARDFGVSPRTVGRAIDRIIARKREAIDFGVVAADVYDDDDELLGARVDDDIDEDNIDDLLGFDKDDEPSREYVYTASNSQISITILEDGQRVDSIVATRVNPRFKDALSLMFKAVDEEDDSYIEQAIPLLSTKQAILTASMGRATVDPDNNTVYYTTDNGEEVPFAGKLVDHLLHMAHSDVGITGDSFGRLMRFADKLSRNPSRNMLIRLYDFLAGADVAINEDGDVACYKKVRRDYTDVFTGQFDNSPGVEVKVERNEVDEDMDRTCSYGLHVCASTYLGHYPGGRVIRVTFDPADAVSCPRDYNDAKLRVCRYQVIEDVTDEFYV